ncbi:MAG: Mov34/MPN/PAD-1 family protein [Oscillospiraceae bacterium]|jgi:hypothetical protein|nr:Mov34/MPN/PAD-1 family protein [Oscillospiraceae bacterium]
MNEQETKNRDNAEIIDLGDDADTEFDPFGDMDPPAEEPTAKPIATPASKPAEDPAPEPDATDANPFESAIAASEDKQAAETKLGLIAKPPVFEYAAAKEEISDTTQTFEALRAAKAADFPELEDAMRVTWTVTYGKVVKNVGSPKTMTIAKQKSEIEQSKEFLDALKKTRGDVVCQVSPKVTAQKKGESSSYRGVFVNLQDAVASGKTICVVPSNDGHVYEIRSNDVGCFITKANNLAGLSAIRAGFVPALPPIPRTIIDQTVAFFRAFMERGNETEALVNVYWDKLERKYHTHVPRQTVTRVEVKTALADIDGKRFVHVADIHSHNTMPARFSTDDDADEKAARLYIVIGRLDRLFPELSVRIASGGGFLELDPNAVIAPAPSLYPSEWLENVAVAKENTIEKVSA